MASTRPIPRTVAGLLSHTFEDGECRRWIGRHTSAGYGLLHKDGYTHRFMYQLVHGSIPEGCEVDHVYKWGCRFKDCIEPSHLEAVPHAENSRRSMTPKHIAHRAGTCTQGHPMSGDNLYTARDGQRRCRTCMRAYKRDRYRAKKGA